MVGLGDFVDDRSEQFHVMQVEHTEQFGDPIVHLWTRTKDNEKVWIEVEGHKPSFYIHEDAYSKRVINHQWVSGVESGHSSIHGESLIKVECELPKHVGGEQEKKGLKEYFETTWEADVFYTSRFLIDTDIYTHVELDREDGYIGTHIDGDFRIHVDDITAVSDPEWRATPRMTTVDIEVLSPDGFPEPDEAEHPVTAITAHDNYTDEYDVWVLRAKTWDYSDTEVKNIAISERPDGVNINDVRVFDDESALLHSFNEYVSNHNPDLLSGWNSSTTDNGRPFDYPYLINRCQKLNVMNYRDWSPMGQVWDSGNWGPSAKGVAFFDMLKGYKKTQWQKPKGGYGLGNIAAKELDYGKEDIDDIDTAWKHDVGTFLKYNIRDVSATVGIDKSAEVVDLFQNIRALAGVQFENCYNNIDLLDVFILRYAKQFGVALPTNTKPTQSWYYGAHVFEPELGRHENCVYPDLWSMYPNMIRNCNMSPETIIGTEDDLAASQYSKDDCLWSYIDTRQPNVKKDDSPDYERVYFLKPEIKEGFMTSVVDDLMGMKSDYKGTDLYMAVKRVVNSVYGVYGDSDSYGKGYRLFDWRIAEGICLGGRKMIQDSSDKFVESLNEIKDTRGYEGPNAYRVGGDTDSVMTAIPFMDDETRDDQQEIVNVALDAADMVNEWYDEWTEDTFNLHGEHFCKLEIESYAPYLFIPKGVTKEKAKKRYAEVIAWEEGEWFDPPEFDVTGIDIVRSDRAEITRDVLSKVLKAILRTDDKVEAREKVYDIIATTVDDVKDGEYPLSYISRPKGMSKKPEEYGSLTNTPMPTYRGAKYVNQHFDHEKLSDGSKPQLLYIEKVRGDYPRTYTAETKEDGTSVDAIAVEHPNEVPNDFVVDIDKMLEKTLRDPLTPILEALHWDYDEALADSKQESLEQFMSS